MLGSLRVRALTRSLARTHTLVWSESRFFTVKGTRHIQIARALPVLATVRSDAELEHRFFFKATLGLSASGTLTSNKHKFYSESAVT